MICFKISKNGNELYIAGHEDMESMDTSILFHKKLQKILMASNSTVRRDSKNLEDLRWENQELSLGDVVSIEIIETDKPTKPDNKVAYGASYISNIEGNEIHSCSFCGKTSDQVDWLITNPAANVCEDCVIELKKIIETEKEKKGR